MKNGQVNNRKIKWGVIAPGRIANFFASDLILSDSSELVAVASRSHERADEFATKFSVPDVYYDYDSLVQSSSCDIVYIASPNVFHKEQVLKCLNSGKAVLCEKPVTLNADDFSELVSAARRNNVFFMEAMWTRFFPAMESVLTAIEAGKIGKVSSVQANFGFKAKTDNEQHRLFNPELGGGSLLDTGVYVISLAQMVYKRAPEEIVSLCLKTKTGVDGTGSYLLRYGHDQMAMLSSSILTQTINRAVIYGEVGYVVMNDFWKPSKATFFFEDGSSEMVQHDITGKGYFYEIKHVEACMSKGLTESPLRNFKDTFDVLRIMDEIQSSWERE